MNLKVLFVNSQCLFIESDTLSDTQAISWQLNRRPVRLMQPCDYRRHYTDHHHALHDAPFALKKLKAVLEKMLEEADTSLTNDL
ncbi:hypothetical protein N5923_23200 [Erwiniaceae bacterium BAC15a-03b]|uniref:Uncharacterized protein n=1 Tax=Winslowiella arboricola TaxID=2978220 RepID=A0A9J6PSG2_9GAMM|nr:hypothetical protein [Winslowiella arboricola]MCU5775144.1 hypothetical protein [Winslowiella arboricola]MCU5780402.1 hypothetical protein [Winslowiella arboricola]